MSTPGFDPGSRRRADRPGGFVKQANREDHEAWVLSTADHFTRCYFHGKRRYETHVHSSLDEAVRAAADDPRPRPWMIYAVRADGRDAHVRNVG